MWLWLDTAYNLTFARSYSGGNKQIGVLGTMGSIAMTEAMDVMSLEFP